MPQGAAPRRRLPGAALQKGEGEREKKKRERRKGGVEKRATAEQNKVSDCNVLAACARFSALSAVEQSARVCTCCMYTLYVHSRGGLGRERRACATGERREKSDECLFFKRVACPRSPPRQLSHSALEPHAYTAQGTLTTDDLFPRRKRAAAAHAGGRRGLQLL